MTTDQTERSTTPRLDAVRVLIIEFTVSYRELDDGAPMPPDAPGLYAQLVEELGLPRPRWAFRDGDQMSGSSGKPSSRPPGWRVDVSALIAEIDVEVAHRHHEIAPAAPARSRSATAELIAQIGMLLPARAVADDDPWLEMFLRDLRRWKIQARIALGYLAPPVPLGLRCRKRVLTRGGWRVIGCDGLTLVSRADASEDVWCSNPDCHDDVAHPECATDVDWLGYDHELGYAPRRYSCRRQHGHTTHNLRWRHGEWIALAQAQHAKA